MEEKHTREQEAKARAYHELMMKQNKGKKGPSLEIADMSVAFDDDGKVMKVSQLNVDHLPDVRTHKDVIRPNVPAELLTQQSQAMLKLQEMRGIDTSKINAARGSQSDFGRNEMADSTSNPFSKKAKEG